MSTTVKVSELPAAVTPLSGTEEVMIVQSGTSRRASASAIAPPGVNNVGYQNIPQNIQNGGTYTFVLADSGKHIYTDNATTNNWTIPPNSSVPFTIGTVITLVGNDPTDSDLNTVLRGVGVTLYQSDAFLPSGDFVFSSQGIATIMKLATNTWMIAGAATPA